MTTFPTPTLHILQQYDAFSFIQKQCSGSRPEILIMQSQAISLEQL